MIYLIFSKDRPLQLELTLSTCKHFSVDWDKDSAIVLYKTSNDKYKKAYDDLETKFTDVKFVKQYNFLYDVLNVFTQTEYVLLSVDDCIFTNYFSTKEIVSTIEKYDTIGFSLRLGENTTYCYPMSADNDVPVFRYIDNDMLLFDCKDDKFGDYYYPLEISSSIYKVSEIVKAINRHAFDNPNMFESIIHSNRHILDYKSTLLCFKTSVAFCNPINKVQNVNWNKVGTNQNYLAESLLEKYEQGYKIDEKQFYGFVSNGCHQEVDLNFIK